MRGENLVIFILWFEFVIQAHFFCAFMNRYLETRVEGGRMMNGGFVDRKLGGGTNRR